MMVDTEHFGGSYMQLVEDNSSNIREQEGPSHYTSFEGNILDFRSQLEAVRSPLDIDDRQADGYTEFVD